MNKLVLNNGDEPILDNDTYILEIDREIGNIINVKGDCKLVIISNGYDIKINFWINDNSSLVVNCIGKNTSSDIKVKLWNNSKIIYNYGLISDKDSINNYEITHCPTADPENSYSEINNGCINLSNNRLYIKIDGRVYQGETGVNCIQNSKIINYGNGDSKIIPNLIIDTNDIYASHSAYIGNIDKETKFYLESRGLTEEEINNLFVKSIILGKMELDEEASLFNEKLKEWW